MQVGKIKTVRGDEEDFRMSLGLFSLQAVSHYFFNSCPLTNRVWLILSYIKGGEEGGNIVGNSIGS
jgi:hypothetical protein